MLFTSKSFIVEACRKYQLNIVRSWNGKFFYWSRNKQISQQINHSSCLPVISKSIQTRGNLYSLERVAMLCWFSFSCSTNEVSAEPSTLLSLPPLTNEVWAELSTLLSLLPASRECMLAGCLHATYPQKTIFF